MDSKIRVCGKDSVPWLPTGDSAIFSLTIKHEFGSEFTNVPQNKSVLFSTHLCNMRPMHISVEYVGNI